MKKLHGIVLAALALSVAAGCSRAEPSPAATSADQPALVNAPTGGAAATDAKPMAPAGAPLAASRALIMTSEVNLTTKNVAATTAKIRSEVEKAGGYVSDANETGSGEYRSAQLEVRVPTNQTRSLRAALADLGEITSEVEKVEDVTEARADLKARLANSRAEEKRILDIMNQRTGTIAEVITAEHELARVRENIERLEAQERSMEGRIALATVKIRINGPAVVKQPEPEAWRTPGKSIQKSFEAGLRGAAAFAVYTAMALAAASPILVPLGAILAVILAIFRNKKKLAQETAVPQPVVAAPGAAEAG